MSVKSHLLYDVQRCIIKKKECRHKHCIAYLCLKANFKAVLQWEQRLQERVTLGSSQMNLNTRAFEKQ